ncbi:MAG: SCO family protein [Gammaproteobacteria bacterium]|nr:SCO family protein [Gammaproteobacteria bacterium]
MQDKQLNSVILIVAAVIALSAGAWFGFDHSRNSAQNLPPKIQGVILPAAKKIKQFELFDAQKNKFSLNKLHGQWHMLFVGYTHCPDVCPTTLAVMKQVTQLMQEQNLQPPSVVFVSIDPERDTPENLAEYVKYFNEDFVGVTGSEKELKNLAQQLAVYFKKVAGSSGDVDASDYLMDHSAAIILINPDAKLHAYLTAPHTPMQIIDAIIRSQAYYNQQKS